MGYPKPAERAPLPKRILARVFGSWPLYWAGEEEGFRGRTRIHLVYCPRCKSYFLDYPRGYRGYFLCPRCDL